MRSVPTLARALFLTSASVGRRGVQARSAVMLHDAANRERLSGHLDAVDASAAPSIRLLSADAMEASDAPVAVLDSSFNPPTRAHLHMLSNAAAQHSCPRKLLLLAKQNADKPVVGASLVQRLEMMELIAAAADPPGSTCCGVTAHPLFVDKATALQALYGREARILVLVGFDTWVRIVDPKYYPPNGGLEDALDTIFRSVEVCVVSRDPASASNLAESDQALSAAEQERTVLSLPVEAARGRLHFLLNEAEFAGISSSEVRKAVAGGSDAGNAPGSAAVANLPECIASYVAEQGLYRES
jgi:nicotinamide-nucleotide adenylyltransferase